jgi:hypothetical protein
LGIQPGDEGLHPQQVGGQIGGGLQEPALTGEGIQGQVPEEALAVDDLQPLLDLAQQGLGALPGLDLLAGQVLGVLDLGLARTGEVLQIPGQVFHQDRAGQGPPALRQFDLESPGRARRDVALGQQVGHRDGPPLVDQSFFCHLSNFLSDSMNGFSTAIVPIDDVHLPLRDLPCRLTTGSMAS